MIIELVDRSGESIGRFQSPSTPRRGEGLSYAGERYAVEDVTWLVETDHDQNVEAVRLEVSEAE
jgi:hypothetical protein